MNQLTLPIQGDLTYSQLRTQCVERYAAESPKLIARVASALTQLEAETKLEKSQLLLQGINETALRLAALNPEWVPFSDTVFEQVILPSKTVAVAAIRTLRELFDERNDHGRNNDDN